MPDWVQIVLRSIVFFVFLLLLSRLLGRKMAARMTLFDVMYAIVLGMIATAVSLKIVANAVYGFIALLTWGLIGVGLSFLSMKSKAVRDFMHGREAVVIKHGKIMEEQLKKMRFTPEDMLQQLRAKQIFNVADVEFAVMESNGEINALLKTDRQPVTPHHLGIQAAQETGTQTVIIDGNIMDEPLFTMGLNRGWLKTELKKIGVAPENVFLAQVDSKGDLHVDLFDDAILPPEPTARRLLLATLEKAKADLEAFALDSGEQETKTMYRQCVREMESLLYDLRPLLK